MPSAKAATTRSMSSDTFKPTLPRIDMRCGHQSRLAVVWRKSSVALRMSS
jgi:hypothetical protein